MTRAPCGGGPVVALPREPDGRNIARVTMRSAEDPMSSKMQTFVVSVIGVALLACGEAAVAKGCIKGAAVGVVVGYVAGHHAVLGAAAGCAVGHHMAKKKQQELQQQQQQQQQQLKVQPKPQPAPQAPVVMA